jgi:H+/Cl- antiporter ClcA
VAIHRADALYPSMQLPLRHVRILRALSRRWQRRLIFTTGALAVGLVAVGMAYAADGAQHAFRQFVRHVPYGTFILTPLGFGLVAWLTARYFPGTQGSGIPQAIAARGLKTPAERRRFVSLYAAFGKVALTLASLLVGASVGREGPTVQVGASLMFEIGRLTPRRQPGLILAGAAAGVAAAFNTPLAGIVFAIEELSRSFEQRTNGLVLYAVIFAGLTSLGLLGNYTYFGLTSATAVNWQDWLMVIACGVLGGLAGGAFGRLLLEISRRARAWMAPNPPRRSLQFALACGLIVAVTGVFTHGATFGTGYAQARGAIEGQPISWFFGPAKFIATLATAVSGIPGGIFAPSLAVGAGIGRLIGGLFGSNAFSLVAVLGMAGYFAGVVQAPMTAFVIILEMTGNSANVIPLMATAVLGFGASKLVSPTPLYHELAKNFLPRPETVEKEEAALTPLPPASPDRRRTGS